MPAGTAMRQPRAARHRALAGAVTGAALGLLAACTSTVDPASLPDSAVLCHGDGGELGLPAVWLPPAARHGHAPPSPAPRPPPPAPRPRPAHRATVTFCTQPPKPDSHPGGLAAPRWMTCTAAPGQATSTTVPTPDSPLYSPRPTRRPRSRRCLGVGEPAQFGSLEGEAVQPGSVATDPTSGATWLIWSQTNPDPGQATAGPGLCAAARSAVTVAGAPITGIQGPGEYQGTESAIAVGD